MKSKWRILLYNGGQEDVNCKETVPSKHDLLKAARRWRMGLNRIKSIWRVK